MDFSKIEFLYKNIPSLKKINNFTNEQKACLENIYNFYRKSLDNNKVSLRTFFIEERRKLNKDTLLEKSLELNKKISRTNEFKNAKTVFCFISFDNEISTLYLLKKIIDENKKLCVPVIKGNIMIQAGISNLTGFKKNKFGIMEPQVYNEIDKDQIDLAIVPALCYNALGYRIGYGQGFYDKFLIDFKGKSVGMVLKEFLINNMIPEHHDEPVDKIIIL